MYIYSRWIPKLGGYPKAIAMESPQGQLGSAEEGQEFSVQPVAEGDWSIEATTDQASPRSADLGGVCEPNTVSICVFCLEFLSFLYPRLNSGFVFVWKSVFIIHSDKSLATESNTGPLVNWPVIIWGKLTLNILYKSIQMNRFGTRMTSVASVVQLCGSGHIHIGGSSQGNSPLNSLKGNSDLKNSSKTFGFVWTHVVENIPNWWNMMKHAIFMAQIVIWISDHDQWQQDFGLCFPQGEDLRQLGTELQQIRQDSQDEPFPWEALVSLVGS